MLSIDEFTPMVQAAQQLFAQCQRDPDKNLREMAEKGYCYTYIASRHALLFARKMAEAETTRSYAEQLSSFGQYRQAEYERLRADTLYQQALKHQAASEKRQAEGDQCEGEALVMMRRRAEAAPPPQPAATAAAPPAQPVRRHREHPPAGGGDGDGDGE